MRIGRLPLLALLKVLSPAIAGSKNQVPELCCVWFDGEYASAFNDVVGVRIKFPTEFTGGLLGEKLIGVLDRSQSKEIDLEIDGEDARLSIGAARIKLTHRPIEDWFWKPEIPDGDAFDAPAEFRDVVGRLLMSVGAASVLNPEQRGVTVVQNGKAADLYSTDAVTLSHAKIDTGKGGLVESGARVILPTPFCELLRAVKSKAEIVLDDNAVYCLTTVDLGADGEESTAKNEMLIFAKLVESDETIKFDEVVKEHVVGSEFVNIPEQLKLRAERAMVLLGEQAVELEVADGQLYLYADTPYGEVDDVVKFAGHPDIKVKVDLEKVHRALDQCDKMTIGKSALVMTGEGGFLHIIATK